MEIHDYLYLIADWYNLVSRKGVLQYLAIPETHFRVLKHNDMYQVSSKCGVYQRNDVRDRQRDLFQNGCISVMPAVARVRVGVFGTLQCSKYHLYTLV